MNSRSGYHRVVRVLGLLIYGVLGAVPYFGSLLVVPPPAAVFLWLVWAAGLVVAIRQSKTWPWAAPITALAALLFWVLFVLAGSWLFGWTA